MARYKIITLIDITRSNAHRAETDKIKIGQQANFNSLLQAIGLRSNCDWVVDPIMNDGRLPDPIEGKATHWVWEFDVERDDVFLKDNDPTFLLKNDLHNVPIVVDLLNSDELSLAAFQTKNGNINTWITLL
jgi:hypothetical protein